MYIVCRTLTVEVTLKLESDEITHVRDEKGLARYIVYRCLLRWNQLKLSVYIRDISIEFRRALRHVIKTREQSRLKHVQAVIN